MVGASKEWDVSYLRKLRKPMVEKKRRDRMNVSIETLKALLTKSSKHPASVVKMDKAEILELAVAHISKLHERPKIKCVNEEASYKAGFRACTNETIRHLYSSATMPNPLIDDLESHLHVVCETSPYQKDLSMSSAALLPGRHYSSSPLLEGMSHLLQIRPYCGNSMFSPIPSIETRGYVMHSPLGNSLHNPGSRSLFSTCSVPSPTLSSCSSSASESSTSGLFVNCGETQSDMEASPEKFDSKNDIVLDPIIKEEKPWRPW